MNSSPINTVLSRILTALGVILVSAGLVAFLMQSWGTLSFTTKLLCTLGFGTTIYCVGLYVYRKDSYYLGDTLFIIALIAIWCGCNVIADLYNISSYSYDFAVARLALIAGLCIVAWLVGDGVISTVGAVISTQSLWWNFCFFATRHWGIELGLESVMYVSLLLFVMYLLLGYWLKNRYSHAYLMRLLGSIGTACTMLILGNWGQGILLGLGAFANDLYLVWRCVLPLSGILYTWLGLKFHDNMLLAGGIFSIVMTILAITLTYGKDTLGLPLALATFGLALIALSYSGIAIKKWYNKQ